MKFRGHLIDNTVKSVYGLAVADINGNGQLDIIAGSTSEPIIAWYEAPHWKRHLVTDQGSGHITIAPHDLTGNGVPDLIVGSGFNSGVNAAGGYLHWLEAPAQVGANWKSHHIADVPFIHRIALANFSQPIGAGFPQYAPVESDKPFLIVASIRGEDGKPGEWHSPGSLWCYELPDAPQDTTSWQSYLLDDSLHINHGLSINDVDGDGRDDVLISCTEGLIWYEPPTLPIGALSKHATAPMTGNWHKWIISNRECSDSFSADIDGDGTNEILAIEPWHGNNLVWYKATGDLRKDPWHRHRIDDTLNRGHSLAAVDVDGDGVLEIICGYNGEGTNLHLYRPENLEKNRWHKETIDDGGLGVGQMHVLDMNGNGRVDIVASGLSTGNVKWYENQF